MLAHICRRWRNVLLLDIIHYWVVLVHNRWLYSILHKVTQIFIVRWVITHCFTLITPHTSYTYWSIKPHVGLIDCYCKLSFLYSTSHTILVCFQTSGVNRPCAENLQKWENRWLISYQFSSKSMKNSQKHTFQFCTKT